MYSVFHIIQTYTGFIRGILRGVRYAKSLRVLFLHRRSPSWTTLVLFSRVVFIFNEPTTTVGNSYGVFMKGILRGIRCTKSLRVLFLHRRPHSWTHGGRWSNHTAQIFLTCPSVSSCVRHGFNPLERFPGFVICGPRYAVILGWLFSAVQASAAQY
jgi:hypothetical protein